MVPLALVTAVVMLVGWFPLTAIWHQQSELNAATAQINAIKAQQHALTLQAKSIDSKSAAILLAREQYQLVAPGQSLIQVLPGVGPNIDQSTGDPGLQPLVSPSSVSSLATPTTASKTHHSSAQAFVSRLVRTLEFWR
jgi:hypothetical protein